jgi:hypothetical protein
MKRWGEEAALSIPVAGKRRWNHMGLKHRLLYKVIQWSLHG